MKISVTVVVLLVGMCGGLLLTVRVLKPLWYDISYDVKEHRDVPFVLIGLTYSDRRATASQALITNRSDILSLWKSRKLLARERAEWIPRAKLPELTSIGWMAYPQPCNHSVSEHCSCKGGYQQKATIVEEVFADGTVCVGDHFSVDWPFALIKMPKYRATFRLLCSKYGLNPERGTNF